MDNFLTGSKGHRVLFLPDWFVEPDTEWENQLSFRDRYQCLYFRLSGSEPDVDGSDFNPLDANERRLVKIATDSTEPLRIVAHGISTILAIRLAALFPTRVASMVLINPRYSFKEHRRLFRMIAMLPRILVPIFLLLGNPSGARGSRWKAMKSQRKTLPSPAAGRYMRDLSEADVFALLPQVSADVFLIAGDRDQEQAVAYAEEMNEELRSSQLVRYANLGHNPHREEPELINAVILEFLKGRQSLWERGLDTIRNFMRSLLGQR